MSRESSPANADCPTVTFQGPTLADEVACAYLPDAAVTVLELAREAGLPLHWRCGLGTCGTCVVRVRTVRGKERLMGNKERNVLAREGHEPALLADGARWRLACSYSLGGESLVVEYFTTFS